ncbi:MAG: 3'-5' exonuclease [Clostridia bacterium]|nr:3'-5' exonuclease [Clostridia bacterium]
MFSLTDGQTRRMIVFDLEWNQSSYAPNHRMPHEIIEIGACRVERDFRVTDTFSALIRPRLYKRLDKHIRSVTGITEAELAEGRSFSDVLGDFISWCGEDAQLVTWGRDDYPVLRRNAAFFMTPMPFEPPLDAQLVFGGACLGSCHQQMNLHAALERMNLTPAVPAHRAVYDAQCTALLLPVIDQAVSALPQESRAQLLGMIAKEKRIANSALRSLPTRYAYPSDALCDRPLMALPCPLCGRRTAFETPWFDMGREKYVAVARCPAHGLCMGQMHFKRAASGQLIMHQRAFPATREEAADVAEQFRLFELTPVKKRHHRLSMPQG